MNRKISYVIPCYGSERTIEGVVREIDELQEKHPEDEYEIILVNDSSPDNVWSVIQKLTKENKRVQGINLAKNFGQHAAIMAGYHFVNGDVVVALDDDGQIPVDETYSLIDHMDNGFDVVYGKYKEKQHSKFRNLGSAFCSAMLVYCIEMPKDFKGSSFFAAKRYVIDEIIKYENPYVFLTGLIFRTTDKIDSVFVNHRKREIGESGYNLIKLIKLWVNGATTFSVRPLRLSALFGSIIAFVGFISAIIVICRRLLNPTIAIGWSSTVSITLLLCGVILIVLGLVGEYVGRMYMVINSTPQYVIRDKCNVTEKDEDVMSDKI